MLKSVEFADEIREQQDLLFVPREEEKNFSFVKYLKKFNIAKTDNQADYIILTISVLLIVVALFLGLYSTFGIGKKKSNLYYIPEKYIKTFPLEIQQRISADQIKK